MGVVNRQASGYTCFVAEKKAAGLGTPKYERRMTATRRYFFARMPLCVFFQWAGFGRDGFGRAGLFRAGVPNLSSARSPVWNREAN